jgi:hypothetical protein
MTPQHSIDDRATRRPSGAPTPGHRGAKRPALGMSIRTGALCALFGLVGSILVAPAEASATPFGSLPFTPGSIVVAQGGNISGGVVPPGTGVLANGGINVYAANSNGNVAPEVSYTNGMYGPFVVIFDPAGDMWAANTDNNTLVEITRAQLGTPNPAPAVTISSTTGALNQPYGMAFDRWGNLWVIGNSAGQIYEYARWQLARSGSPTPVVTIPTSSFPGTPLGDAFDAHGNLWVTIEVPSTPSPTSACPNGCVVEFSRAELSRPDPQPTVTISSTGGANMAFSSSGDMWMVTGGGTPCYGTPCNNELVEFTRAQLSSSGAPNPAVIISTTLAGQGGSMYGPYGVAVDRFGDVWVSNFNEPSTVEFARYQLFRSGSPTPARTITGDNTGMNWPSFVVVAP